jgi:hypothetical protein
MTFTCIGIGMHMNCLSVERDVILGVAMWISGRSPIVASMALVGQEFPPNPHAATLGKILKSFVARGLVCGIPFEINNNAPILL